MLEKLLKIADERGFVVDVRGPLPTLIAGVRAKQIRTDDDLSEFLDGYVWRVL